MNEPQPNGSLVKETRAEVSIPVGLIELGSVEPSTLNEQDFKSSPDLLYHGSNKKFEFHRVYDYRSPDYYAEHDGSQTLGEGFYTSANKREAERYSVLRQGHTTDLSSTTYVPIVAEILPYKARVFDFRDAVDLSKNAAVPREIFDAWKAYFYRFATASEMVNLPGHIVNTMIEYKNHLWRVQALQHIDLRVMLATAATRELSKDNMVLPSPPWAKLFSNFMRDQGYDGLVFIEAGETRQSENSPSYVFYGLDRIGTFETWHTPSQAPDAFPH